MDIKRLIMDLDCLIVDVYRLIVLPDCLIVVVEPLVMLLESLIMTLIVLLPGVSLKKVIIKVHSGHQEF